MKEVLRLLRRILEKIHSNKTVHRWDITPPTPPTPPAGGPTTLLLASTTDKNFCHGHVRFDNLRRQQKRRESGSNGKAATETARAAATKASQQQAPRQLRLGKFIASIWPGGRSRGPGCTVTLQTGKSFLLQHKKTPAGCADVAPTMRWRAAETLFFFAFLRLEDLRRSSEAG